MRTIEEVTCTESPPRPKKAFARQNYYFGKLLTAQDLQGEQNYVNEKRWLINRYGIGWGVLCGLKVVPDPTNPCRVFVEPGIALDQYGNEIVVRKPEAIDLEVACVKKRRESGQETQDNNVYLAIRYVECPSGPAPLPVEDCGSLETGYVYNRTIEAYEINVSCDQPDPPKSLRSEFEEILKCETDCTRFLSDPAPLIIEKCLPQEKYQEFTLARICYREGVAISEQHIDNTSFRKLAFSNEMLYELIGCLSNELSRAKGARRDRRRHIPLLANTIKGLTYQDGRIARLDDVAIHPHRITSDGDVIWITDRDSPRLVRIDRQTNQVMSDDIVDLKCSDDTNDSSWAIAFDGTYMWITHNNEGPGKITRVSTCDLTDCWTFSALPSCDILDSCDQYCYERKGTETQNMPSFPQELVYHQQLLYVSHGWRSEPSNVEAMPIAEQAEVDATTPSKLTLTIIDTQRCCVLKCVEIESDKGCIAVGPIVAMVSDGEALWVTYKAQVYGSERPVVRSIRYISKDVECDVSEPYSVEKGTQPEKMIFDGTHLWVTHDDGATKLDVSSGHVVRHTATEQKQTALVYGGGENVWTTELSAGEARINRVDIHSANRMGEIEYMKYTDHEAEYEITDAQFDGSFIYISARYGDAKTGKKGVIHRILP